VTRRECLRAALGAGLVACAPGTTRGPRPLRADRPALERVVVGARGGGGAPPV